MEKNNLLYLRDCLLTSLLYYLNEFMLSVRILHMLIFTFLCDRNSFPMQNVSGDSSIWLKEKWNPGEVKDFNCPIYLERSYNYGILSIILMVQYIWICSSDSFSPPLLLLFQLCLLIYADCCSLQCN